MINRRIAISITLPLASIDILDNMAGGNTSKKVNNCINLYDQVQKFKEVMNDPAKATEFQAKIQEKLKNDELEQWAETLSDQQLEGLIGFLQLQKEMRVKQGILR